ncbi:multidrug ABC transporter ATP-binding protein [Terrabacter sp. Root85]|uniref:ABC transporter ATP-binding protein n=1 Tax=unclassified Terrabacter TaxID=2630222 RepID=UPI0006FBA69D|nr:MULTISPECIES: ATP-binding cassette domain-containing protein [unclassified Terrabacter]KRC88310.1 multidrug ABC transporter ATP-binding protein [Terrabacter sp. Root85]KRF45586.1 multidrug ABC transporter ATP-binding protein [Terrabacter sp. Soil811]
MGAVAVLTGEVRAEGVGKTIDETTLLLPTDVSADPGECIVLRGPNGSGKTTLLRIIGGLLVPSTGTATIGGREADERDRTVRAAVAALLGAPTTYRDLTLVDHLVLIDSTWGGDPATSDDRSLALLDRLGIAHLDDRFPHELSSGQEQLFRLALTFSRPASVVLLDEPEQRLDTGKRQVVAELIRERTESGGTVVMACHDPDLTATLATRVVDIVPAR